MLRDGRPCHVRPIRPDDAGRLVEFHSRLSAETIYFRFFAPYPQLSERDVQRFVNVDHADRVALVATEGGADHRRRALRPARRVRRRGRVRGPRRPPEPRGRGGAAGAPGRRRLGARAAPVRRGGAAQQPPDDGHVPRGRLRGPAADGGRGLPSHLRPGAHRAGPLRPGGPRAPQRGALRRAAAEPAGRGRDRRLPHARADRPRAAAPPARLRTPGALVAIHPEADDPRRAGLPAHRRRAAAGRPGGRGGAGRGRPGRRRRVRSRGGQRPRGRVRRVRGHRDGGGPGPPAPAGAHGARARDARRGTRTAWGSSTRIRGPSTRAWHRWSRAGAAWASSASPGRWG